MVNPNVLLLVPPPIRRLIKHFMEDLVYSSHYAGWFKKYEKKISEMQKESHMDPKNRGTSLPIPTQVTVSQGCSWSCRTSSHRELSPFSLPVASIIIALISDILELEPFKGFKPKQLNINKSKQNQS